MPIIPGRPRRSLTKARERVGVALDWVLATAGSSAFVAATALILWLLRVDFQYVAGAFLIVFAHRLAQKRLYPEVNVPEAPRPRPVRETFQKPEDPLEPLSR